MELLERKRLPNDLHNVYCVLGLVGPHDACRVLFSLAREAVAMTGCSLSPICQSSSTPTTIVNWRRDALVKLPSLALLFFSLALFGLPHNTAV